MVRSITIAAAVALSVAAFVLLPMHGSDVAAQSGPLTIVAVDLDIAPGQIANYMAAIKENGVMAVKEPGCREFNISISDKDPNHVFLFEVYDNAAALEAHRATDHFKKYAAATKEMVAKRETRMFSSVAMNMKGK
jgi:(4S)-4-hydroxy-5-phosphonooxypentane-2,3-dione isomerase